ncbi:MAG: DEAD/DEAH box helicase [Candidatus Margulisbacteria bacterium]|jgi:ATP-dependent RNA helicase RhlE|nr:DEAD/DEAH box helicase [Candidatus Margulisiibacteriota bacterium]
MPHTNFFGLGIAPGLLDVLQKLKFVTPTPIQAKAIPTAIEGKDLIGVAQTGTGKTLAFGVPMIQRLAGLRGKGLVLAPTRELALQIDDALRPFVNSANIRTAVLIGGASMHLQVQALRRQPRIIVATPGRLNDHLEQRTVNLSDVNILVLDEADRMLDMGFAPQISRIVRHIPPDRQTLLFSATMPSSIINLARSYMKLPVQVEVAPAGTAAENVTQEVFFIRKEDKPKLLGKMLEQYRGTVLIFSRTKRGASRIARGLKGMGHNAAEIHSDRSLAQRKEALQGFKTGKYRILVATDIAARGIDVTGIELVVNYDLPDDAENYVHRIGRTGRAGQEGRAVSFATPEQSSDVRNIEKLMRTALPVAKHPELSVEVMQPKQAPPTIGTHWRQRGLSSYGARHRRRR